MGKRINSEVIDIDVQSTKAFFDNRKKKELPHRYNYVNYQDDKPEVALERDRIEKGKIERFIHFKESDYILDIGCGVGRWGDAIIPQLNSGKYVGVDYTQDFIDIAKNHFQNQKSKFICAPFQTLKTSLEKEKILREYDVILINGVLMYINDEDIDCCLGGIDSLLKKEGFIYIKESVGIKKRLTLVDFYSTELEANYNVIYRSIYEYTKFLSKYFLSMGYAIISCGPTWKDEINFDDETSNYYWILMK